MEIYQNSIKFSQSLLNSIDDCLKYSNTFNKLINEKDQESKLYSNDNFLSFLESDINYVQQIIDRKRRTYLGDDILVYVLDPGLVEPEYYCPDDKPEDPERVLLRQRRQRLVARLRARAERQHSTEKSQVVARQSKLWRPYQPNEQEVLAARGNEIFVEPLRLERENLKRAKEEEEIIKIEWKNREEQVEPYLNEVKEYGEPRHKIQSQFWINLLGSDICQQNILVFEQSPKKSYNNNIKIAEEEINTVFFGKENNNKVKRSHKIRDFKHQEAERKQKQKVLAAMSEEERLRTQAAWQRDLEKRQLEERLKKQWQPRKADVRKRLRKRFNEPPKEEPVKVIKQAPRELTDLEKKQLHAKLRHKYEMKQMQEHEDKFYRPGKLNDLSQLKVRKQPKIPVPDNCEDKEFRLFATRFINKRHKELVQKFKWRNIVYPRPYTFGLGLKIFPGFTPASEKIIKADSETI